jgi:hypothetical protein
VKDIIVRNSAVNGVRFGPDRELMRAETVVLCAGHGLHKLLDTVGFPLVGQLRSRVVTMVAFPNRGLARPIQPLNKKGVGAVPAPDDLVIIGVGSTSERTLPPGNVPIIDPSTVERTIQAARSIFCDVIALERPVHVWPKIKTDIPTPASPGTNPNPVLLAHDAYGVRGLWTFLPGKMTLAFHASQEAAETVLRKRLTLDLPAIPETGRFAAQAELLVAPQPWTSSSTLPR